MFYLPGDETAYHSHYLQFLTSLIMRLHYIGMTLCKIYELNTVPMESAVNLDKGV
jgi:hypothetical protein